ncbi:RIP metalloprotease RseP [Phocaeicola coprophilus]|uniref:RIP metalloprotease RseP n=1 Tax=Phocaeicola coprophilus TaxID=387090 RepID=UPI00266EA9B7|nr:RIP metalloprotease RseP [Phocaeicola coprophilus]
METFLIRALQLVLSLSLLVIIHEGGHFFFARLFKIRVEKFYIFFDPWFSLFKFKPKNSETEYGIGWLPLGGYCKISGMIDESMDTEQMKQQPQPWEFRSKPAWQRLLVMIGGVLMNFLLALFIYSMILFTWGDQYIALKDMSYGMKFNETAREIGFRDGDILVSADGKELTRYNVDMLRSLAEAREVVVLRDGKEEQILMPEISLLEIAKEDPPFVDMLIPNVVDSVLADGGFAKAGLQKGDSLIAFNGTPLHSWNEFTEQLGELRLRSEVEQKSSASFSLVYSRAGVRDTVNVTTDDQFKVLAYSMNPGYQPTRLTYGFFESFPAGVALGINTLKGYVNDMKYVFTKEGAKSVGGFGTIGSIFPKVWDWQRFWSMTAFLSIILAFMNILPIPALDGGHVLFLLYELVARRKPSDKFLEYAQMVGMFLLFGLLIWANFNDILRFVF